MEDLCFDIPCGYTNKRVTYKLKWDQFDYKYLYSCSKSKKLPPVHNDVYDDDYGEYEIYAQKIDNDVQEETSKEKPEPSTTEFEPITTKAKYINNTPIIKGIPDKSSDKTTNAIQPQHTCSQAQHCHICDVSVPASRMEQHIRGKKHVVSMKIAMEAMRRTYKHITQALERINLDGDNYRDADKNNYQSDNDNYQSDNDKYYCEVCNIVTGAAKSTHLATREHMVRDVDYKFLTRFHDRYVRGPEDLNKKIVKKTLETKPALKEQPIERDVKYFGSVDLRPSNFDNTIGLKSALYEYTIAEIEDGKWLLRIKKSIPYTKTDASKKILPNNMIYCTVCREKLFVWHHLWHTRTVVHKDNMLKYNSIDADVKALAAVGRTNAESEKSKEIREYCNVCNTVIRADTMFSHVNDRRHLCGLLNIYKPVVMISWKTAMCRTCERIFDRDRITQHVSSKKHRRRVLKK